MIIIDEYHSYFGKQGTNLLCLSDNGAADYLVSVTYFVSAAYFEDTKRRYPEDAGFEIIYL